MVVVAQLVRAPDCGSGGRGFETHLPPKKREPALRRFFFAQYFWWPIPIAILSNLFNRQSKPN
jgi:hypothetical protein